MSGIVTRRRIVWGLVSLAWWLAPAAAEMAKVQLKDGTTMRGDVELTEGEALIRNEAGVVRCQRERVDQIEWLEPPKTVQGAYMRRFWVLAPDDVQGHAALAGWLVEQKAFEAARKQCEYVLKLEPDHHDTAALLEKVEKELAGEPGEQQTAEGIPEQRAGEGTTGERDGKPVSPRYEGVPPPPPLSPRDILRLKLSEVELDGPAERLNVRFLRARGERDVEDLVRAEMFNAPDYDPDWSQTLEQARPYEKLPVVLKATGLKYADRIEIRGHPRVFSTYRQRVLPLVAKGCVRSGCHGGRRAHAFRFPIGSQSSDEFLYTSFVILDEMGTAAGPMIDRALPEQSALLRYMLPADKERPVHPPVRSGRVMPVLRGTRDHRYQPLVDWISSLRSPHPDYGLEYEFPAWFAPLSKRLRASLILDEQPAEGKPEQRGPAEGLEAGDKQPSDDENNKQP
ncbi:MAG: hypothetical protein ACE5I3_13390 [Phycisphaerae bacterium]